MRNYTNPPILKPEEALANLRAEPRPWADDYLAMYSSWMNGIVTDPWLMNVPLDDHIVHRGDGVFEATKCVGGRIYQFREHLERLTRSARSIRLQLPLSLDDLTKLVIAVIRAGGEPDCLLRIYISRGPGGFTTNPQECPECGVYVMAGHIHPPSPEQYEKGVEVGVAQVPPKSGYFADVKSCNYLPNVLLKDEAVSRGWNFAVGLDENGFLAEGSTENFGLVDASGRLLLPEPDHILEGTTVKRAAILAREMAAEGLLAGVEHQPLSVSELENSAEAMLFGTTLDILPITRLDGKPVADGKVGPVAKELLARMRDDILSNPDSSTRVFD